MAESHTLAQLAELMISTLNKRSLMVVPVESCTGDLVSVAITDVSGSSAWFERGSVVYSDEVKSQMLDVPAVLIHERGAVSEPVAHAMIEGAVLNSRAQVAVMVIGVADPTGDTPDKPIGMVYFGQNSRLQTRVETCHFKDDRKQVRLQAAEHVLRGLLDLLGSAEC